MSFVAPIRIAPAKRSRVAALASRPLLVALLLVALITAARLTGTVDSDVAWQLWIAGQMHKGANLYRDIIETNPPLWFWMAVPIERVATLLHVRIESALIVAMCCLGALSLLGSNRFLAHLAASRRTVFLCVAAIMLCAMPWMHVGQREQIVMFGALPYAALIAARREGRPVSPIFAIAIGAGAGLGFALKHYFLLVPALLELWLVASQAKRWRALRPETLTLGMVGATYAGAILLFEPDFLSRIVPLLGLAYGAFGAPDVTYLFGPFALVTSVLVVVLAIHARHFAGARQAPLTFALAITAVGFAAAYFIQFKGWTYQTIPVTGFASMAIVALLVESRVPLHPLRLVAPALLSLPLFLAAEEQLHPGLPSPDLLNAVASLRPEDTVGFLTTETAIPWSVTLQGGYRYSSRYNGFWMLRAVVSDEQLGGRDPRLAALGRQVVSATVVDFRCAPPKQIIIARPRSGEPGFDILPFFLRNPYFGQFLSHYRVVSRNSLETYELASPLRPDPSACTRIR